MRKNNTYYIRRTHRFLGVFIGIQFLFWTLSGLYFSWTDIDEIHGDHFHASHQMELDATELQNPALLDSTLKITSLELRVVNHQPYYWINGEKLFHGTTGKLRGEITSEEAIDIAKNHLVDDLSVRHAEYLTETGSHHEYRGRPLPVWAVHFDHEEDITAYVDAKSGSFERIRHKNWRWFDFLWMFHTMDYAGRDNFNNYLLRAFSLFGLVTIVSGFTLFFMTQKRSISK